MIREFLDRGLSPALLVVSAVLLARPLPARVARVAWGAVLVLALGFSLALNVQPANFPASNFDHYWLGAKYPLHYDDTYRVILAGEDRAPLGMRDLEHPDQIVRADSSAQRAYWIDLLRGANVAFDPLAPLDSLSARARASGALAAELRRTLAAALPAGRIESFRRDARAVLATGQGEHLTLDYGYNGSPFYGLLRQLDPTLHLPFGPLVAWAGLLLQIAGLALVAFLAAMALGLTTVEGLAVAALVAASLDFSSFLLPGLVFTEVWAPVLFAAWAMRRDRPALAGVAIAVAGLVKLFPFLMLLPALVVLARSFAPSAREDGALTDAARAARRRALVLLASCAVATLGLGAASLAGGRSWTEFLHKVATEFQWRGHMVNGVSLSALLAALGVLDRSPLPRLFALASLVLLALVCARDRDATGEAPARRALVLLAATGWLVQGWLNYYAVVPFLLVPLLARTHRRAAVAMVLAMAGAYALPALDDPQLVARGGLHALKLLPYLAVPAGLVALELRGMRVGAWVTRAAYGAAAALVLLTGITAWRDHTASDLVGAGEKALNAGNPRGAAALLGDAIRLSPGIAIAHRNHGIALVELDRMSEALPEFARAVALAPHEAGAHHDYGRALAMGGRGDEAVTQFEQAHALSPDDVQTTYELARARLTQGRRREAVVLLQRAHELAPGDAGVDALLKQASTP